MSHADFSSGLPASAEAVIQIPPNEPFWAENLLFALHDPKADIAFWLHLGTVPNDWTMWEDRVHVALPGDQGVLWMWAYHRTAPERRPGGSNLEFRCIEPFRRWKVGFDGYAMWAPNEGMFAGLPAGGIRRRLVIDLDVTCATPVWDARTARGTHGGHGMAAQNWAKEHYEQLYRASGFVEVEGQRHRLDAATGWRDHSRGPRHGPQGDPWGGHVILGCLFPSGRAMLFSRYWKPDGVLNLDGGCIIDRDGRVQACEILETPRLVDLQPAGEALPIRLRWPGGECNTVMRCERAIWIPRQRKFTVGKDLSGKGLMYVLNYGPVEWDGETGWAYVERSDHLNALPAAVRPA